MPVNPRNDHASYGQTPLSAADRLAGGRDGAAQTATQAHQLLASITQQLTQAQYPSPGAHPAETQLAELGRLVTPALWHQDARTLCMALCDLLQHAPTPLLRNAIWDVVEHIMNTTRHAPDLDVVGHLAHALTHAGDDAGFQKKVLALTMPQLKRGIAAMPHGVQGISTEQCRSHIVAIEKMQRVLSQMDGDLDTERQSQILEVCIGVHGMATHYICVNSSTDAKKLKLASRQFSETLKSVVEKNLPKWDQDAGVADPQQESRAKAASSVTYGVATAPAGLSSLVAGTVSGSIGLGISVLRAVAFVPTIVLDAATEPFNEGSHKTPGDRWEQIYQSPGNWAAAGSKKGWHFVDPDSFADQVYKKIYPERKPPEGTASYIARKFLKDREEAAKNGLLP